MATKLWTKVIAGSSATKSRLHDQDGTLISASRLIRNGPRALVTGFGRLAFGMRPVRPWISYDAQKMLAARLKPGSRVLEFGSGMSTAWYAEHAGQVVAIEDFRPWYDKVREILTGRGHANVAYRFAATRDDYVTLADEERRDGFDLIMIDGSHRDRCVDLAISAVRRGGMIFLDNADKHDTDTVTGHVPDARRKLLDYAASSGAAVTWFTDFAPTQLFVQTGLAVAVRG